MVEMKREVTTEVYCLVEILLIDHHTRFEISSAHLNNLICYIIYGNVVKKTSHKTK